MSQKYSRRNFIRQSFLFGSAAAGAGFFISSCNNAEIKKEATEKAEAATKPASGGSQVDTTALNEADLAKRKQLGYVEQTPLADNHCSNCALYILPKDGRPGGCQLFKGAVNPNGYCTYWAAPQQ